MSFCHSSFDLLPLNPLMNKKIQSVTHTQLDEARQGEALLLEGSAASGLGKKLFLESYGCAMNFADSEVVASILKDEGYTTTRNFEDADVIFVNTCAIRENAEQRVRTRLYDYNKVKRTNPDLIIGVLGCMAERLKGKLLEEEKLVDLVVGPDAYRHLPLLLKSAEDGQRAINVLLSKEETYADITPVRLGSNGVSAYISITRGCDNMCSFCVVPFTRGRERSREPQTIIQEAKSLWEAGYREVTLLGQNVDSYLWSGGGLKKETYSQDELSNSVSFAQLLEQVALSQPGMRIRFSTSHPKDMTNEVLMVMSKYDNICNYIHLPVQSGNSRILDLMNRGYSREWYMERIQAIREFIPDCGISTDTISGFCTETEEDHQETLSLMEWVGYEFSYMFKYSERPKTLAERKYPDDVPEPVKQRRLSEIINLQSKLSLISNKRDLNKVYQVLVESKSKRSDEFLSGRTPQNKVVVFPKENYKPGDFVNVLITDCTPATLMGTAVGI
jgi:tRNA-2-methylthio-N6-dimethylallyladenosine synthase